MFCKHCLLFASLILSEVWKAVGHGEFLDLFWLICLNPVSNLAALMKQLGWGQRYKGEMKDCPFASCTKGLFQFH